MNRKANTYKTNANWHVPVGTT